MKAFSLDDAAEIYGIDQWSAGYFRIGNNGEVLVSPEGPEGPSASLRDVIQHLQEDHQLPLPMLLRFPQILENRLQAIHRAFTKSMKEYAYPGRYQAVFPIKVNQNRAVVETLSRAGEAQHYGLEAGSKAELAICLAMHRDPEALICCNGFKDRDFMHLALMARKMGRQVVITLEKPSELDLVLNLAEEMQIEPMLGIRFRLYSRGSGLWEKSGGDLSKFGFNAAEMLGAFERLEKAGSLSWLRMLHCHIGSQITDIRKIKKAVKEASRVYVEAIKMGASVEFLNVGGGLGVDYDGSRTTFHSSVNYTLQEYANDVVWNIWENCKEEDVPAPCIVTESGRAVTAYHGVLVLPVMEAVGPLRGPDAPESIPEDAPGVIKEMAFVFDRINQKNFREMFHDALAQREEMYALFSLGYLNLRQRATGEALFYKICAKVLKQVRAANFVPDDMENLEDLLADRYICNFSLFQSLPDFWAVGTLFPIMPLQRLKEKPQRQATLADITCDSDGKVDKFTDLKDVRHSLPLHQLKKGEAYYLGGFLVGAYQEVLGDQHNLFGRVAEAMVQLGPDGSLISSLHRKGQSLMEVAEPLGYTRDFLQERFLRALENSALGTSEREELLSEFLRALSSYTYLS